MELPALPRAFARPGAWTLALVLVASLGIGLYALASLTQACALVTVFAWMAIPGVLVAPQLYGPHQRSWIPVVLIGPAWGFASSSVALLALWVSGVRQPAILALAPLAVSLLAIPARQVAPCLCPVPFDRRDVMPVLVVLLLVPLASAARSRESGRCDPKERRIDTLHYYWLTDLLAAVEHRVAGRSLALEPIILVNETLVDLCYVAFLYFFVRHFVRSPRAAAIGVVAAVLFTSFEGAWQLYDFWQHGKPLAAFRLLNIDAISNWVFGSLKIDGLHRVLLYQMQHATAWAVSLSALIVLLPARDNGRPAVNLLAGLLLGVSLLVSSFIAVMVGCVVAVYQATSLGRRRQWKALVLGAFAGGVPVGMAVLVSSLLQYVDRSGGQIVYVGNLNPVAAHHAALGIVLSFGPMLIGASAGAGVALWRRAGTFAVLAIAIAVSFLFYFFVDVVDHQHAYVGWRAGHLLFMAFAPLVAFAWQEFTALGGWARRAAIAVAAVLTLAAAPMTLVDLYNAQDTDNQAQGPGFRWTEVVTPDELQALEWLKAATPVDAQIQVDPVRESGTWAYMPAFGERRMTAGMPISMCRSQSTSKPANAYAGTRPRRTRMPPCSRCNMCSWPARAASLSAARGRAGLAPDRFNPVFRNGSVTIYRVAGRKGLKAGTVVGMAIRR